jgi:trans-aconitate methyltransferase
VDPVEDHADEAAAYLSGFERVLGDAPATLLELGAGGGHNACFMKQRYACTLTDSSPGMLALSRELNPECEHILGDMRTLRLDRTFHAVFVHDAVMYLTSEADLAAAVRTAFLHTAPGGAAIFAPDFVRESLREMTETIEGKDGDRELRCLAWTWDPDPADTTYVVDYAYLLRERNDVRAVHDRHVEGIFPRQTWMKILVEAGYDVEPIARPFDDYVTDEIFLCRAPSANRPIGSSAHRTASGHRLI